MYDRSADHPIEPIFLNRWSPRAFEPTTMPEADLLTAVEAARWAPSAFNVQPWRFLYALRNDEHWDGYLTLLDEFNRGWAQNASAIVFVLSATHTDHQGVSKPLRSHSFDTGAAWAQFALQATHLGYHTHGMAGLHYDLAREHLAVPQGFQIQMAIAVGRRTDPSHLPEPLRDREQPSQRRRTDESAFRGPFPQ